MRYFVEYVGFVDPMKNMHHLLDKEAVVQEMYDVKSIGELQGIVNDRFRVMVSGAGLVIWKDNSETQDESMVTFDRRRFIPWHVITHMEVRVKMVPEPSSTDPLIPIHVDVTKNEKEKIN